MKLTKIIANLIGKHINENYTIDNIPTNIVLIGSLFNNGAGKLFLYDIQQERVIAFIVFDAFVDRVYSEYKGLGTFLYETAMTYRFPKGLSMSREGSTSKSALNVWRKFNQRPDIIKKRHNHTGSTYKKEKLPSLIKNDAELKEILDLEDTEFFYNYGKSKLQKMLEIGEKYMNENYLDVDSMEIDIDFGEDY